MSESLAFAPSAVPGAEMQDLITGFDWARTPIRSPDTWSPALRTTVRNLLASRFPQIRPAGRAYF
jgi:hypothetical protein